MYEGIKIRLLVGTYEGIKKGVLVGLYVGNVEDDDDDSFGVGKYVCMNEGIKLGALVSVFESLEEGATLWKTPSTSAPLLSPPDN